MSMPIMCSLCHSPKMPYASLIRNLGDTGCRLTGEDPSKAIGPWRKLLDVNTEKEQLACSVDARLHIQT